MEFTIHWLIHRVYPELIEGIEINEGDWYVCNEGTKNRIFEWYTDKYPKPTDEELQQWYKEFKYLEKRHYPPITKQLELLFDELKETGTISKDGKWYKEVQAVKDKAPKGE